MNIGQSSHDLIHLQVTILPRTSAALGFAQYTPIDKKLYSPEELMDRMCMALGGRVAESLTFNSITTGAQNDLQKVTNMAYAQIQQFGFNDVVGLVSFEQGQGAAGGRRPFSKRLAATMDHEARKLIAEAYQKTEGVLNVCLPRIGFTLLFNLSMYVTGSQSSAGIDGRGTPQKGDSEL